MQNSPTMPKPGGLTAFPCGFGQSDTHAVVLNDGSPNRHPSAGTPYSTITMTEIESMVMTPQTVAKERGQWFIPSDHAGHDARSHAAQRERGRFHALTADVDKGNPALDALDAALVGILGDVRRLIYSTASATPELPRWRVVIPLASPLPGIEFSDTQKAFFDLMGEAGIICDYKLTGTGQLVYLPNAPSGFYDRLVTGANLLHLGPNHHVIVKRERDRAMIAEGREAAARVRQERAARGGDDAGVIDQYNAIYSVAQMLEQSDYSRAGDESIDWRSKYQSSNSYATRDMGDHWVSLSGSDADEGIGAPTASGARHGDAFDLFCHFQCDRDVTKAVRAARSFVGLTNHRQNAPEGIPQMPGVDAPAPVLRDFETLNLHARHASHDDPDAIDSILAEAMALDPVKQGIILKALKEGTGLPLRDLRAQIKRLGKDDAPDHLELARAVLDGIGRENLISTAAGVWRWQDRGVWQEQVDRAVKQSVQSVIDDKGQRVTNTAVVGVSDVLKTEIFRPDHAFNIGNPESVNCQNGLAVLDGGVWTLHPHRREDYRTTQIPVAFDPTADAPRFRQFLSDVFRNDPDHDDKVTAMCELIGYSLMSHAHHERFVMLFGEAGTGKSILLAIIEALVGKANVSGVQPSKFDGFQRAHMRDKLVNIVTELKQGEVIADAALKSITSGEVTTTEQKHRDPFDLHLFCTNWFATNHMPHTRDFSNALMRRAVILTFNRVFAQTDDENVALKKTDTHFGPEMPGILTACLSAYAGALARGWTIPASSLEAVREWRREADSVAQFVDDRCEVSPGANTLHSVLFDDYLRYAAQEHIKMPVGSKEFGKRMERLKYPKGKDGHGQRTLGGIKLVAPQMMGGFGMNMTGSQPN